MPVLSGAAIVVTGAGRGLGLAYARHAAASGAAVLVNDIDADAAQAAASSIISAGGQAAWSGHSVCDPSSAQALVSQCVDTFGRLDGLVNNAGIRPEGPAWSEDPLAVRAAVEVPAVPGAAEVFGLDPDVIGAQFGADGEELTAAGRMHDRVRGQLGRDKDRI